MYNINEIHKYCDVCSIGANRLALKVFFRVIYSGAMFIFIYNIHIYKDGVWGCDLLKINPSESRILESVGLVILLVTQFKL